MEITIKIREKDYKIKQSFRSYLLYEERTGKQIGDIVTMKDILELLYCTFRGCNKDFSYDFDEFIDIVDEDGTILDQFNKFNNDQITSTSEKNDGKKKKG